MGSEKTIIFIPGLLVMVLLISLKVSVDGGDIPVAAVVEVNPGDVGVDVDEGNVPVAVVVEVIPGDVDDDVDEGDVPVAVVVEVNPGDVDVDVAPDITVNDTLST